MFGHQNKKKEIAIAVGLLLASLLLCEALLQIGSYAFQTVDVITAPPGQAFSQKRYIIDPRNGYKGNPDYPEHDDWGYRNPRRPENMDIVAIGDSWTYGASVGPEEMWSMRLSEISNRNVYNMGMGGHSLINYFQAFHRALSLDPKVMIVGLYFGNDFIVTGNQLKMDLADEATEGSLAALRQTITDIENADPIDFPYYLNCGQQSAKAKRGLVPSLRRWLSKNSRLYGLFRAMKTAVTRDDEAAADAPNSSSEQERLCYRFSDGQWETVFTNALRARLVDHSDPRVSTGLELAKSLLTRMGKMTQAKGIEFLVVLFPTKESAFIPRIGASTVPDQQVRDELEALSKNEAHIRAQLMQALARQGIGFIDILPYLEAAEKQPFFTDRDGHLNAYGNLLVAQALNSFLEQKAE